MDYDYTRGAQMQASSLSYGSTEVPAAPGLHDRINQLGNPLAESIHMLGEIETRLFGPRPQEVSKDGPPILNSLSASLDLTQRGANEVLERISRILRQL